MFIFWSKHQEFHHIKQENPLQTTTEANITKRGGSKPKKEAADAGTNEEESKPNPFGALNFGWMRVKSLVLDNGEYE